MKQGDESGNGKRRETRGVQEHGTSMKDKNSHKRHNSSSDEGGKGIRKGNKTFEVSG
jgi:hypothetical protein